MRADVRDPHPSRDVRWRGPSGERHRGHHRAQHLHPVRRIETAREPWLSLSARQKFEENRTVLGKMRIALGVVVCVAFAGGSLALAQPAAGGKARSRSLPQPSGGLRCRRGLLGRGPAMEVVRTDWDAAAKLSPLTPAPTEFPQGRWMAARPARLRQAHRGRGLAPCPRGHALGRALPFASRHRDRDRRRQTKLAKLTVSVDDGVVYSAPRASARKTSRRVRARHRARQARHHHRGKRADAKDET